MSHSQCRGDRVLGEIRRNRAGRGPTDVLGLAVRESTAKMTRQAKATKAFPAELRWAARWKLQYLHEAADLRDLKSPPGNRFEGLKGDLKGFHSILFNDQWRVVS